MTETTIEMPPIGSRWHTTWAGTVTIHSHTILDGEPAVREAVTRKGKTKTLVPVLASIFLRKATPLDTQTKGGDR